MTSLIDEFRKKKLYKHSKNTFSSRQTINIKTNLFKQASRLNHAVLVRNLTGGISFIFKTLQRLGFTMEYWCSHLSFKLPITFGMDNSQNINRPATIEFSITLLKSAAGL